MATTSPDNIWTPDSGDDYALTVDLAAMADTVQDAITDVRGDISYRADLTNAQRLALSGADLYEGLTVRTTDTRREWLYSGSTWLAVDTGSYLMYPSSLFGATIGSDATILPTAGGTAMVISGVFSPRFRSYEVEFGLTMSTSAAGIGLRLSTAGAPNETNNYIGQRIAASGTSLTASSSTQTFWSGTGISGSNLAGRWKFRNPSHTSAIKTFAAEAVQAPGTGYSQESGFLAGADSSVFDGFRVSASTGTFQGGFIKVYGLA